MTDTPRIYSVKELTRYIKMKLEGDRLLGDVWIRGEISNFTHHSSGHMYFTIKDKDSRLKCIMFASHNQRLPFRPREGAKVIARGNISVYERDGNYQFYCISMQPDGLGSLYLAYEQLKAKLEEEGLFAESRKRELPRHPSVVGVVTSPTGAAVRDIITTLQRRYPAAAILVYPAVVQGAGAAPSIVKGIEAMNRHGRADVLIVGRGGGSLEELWAFNEETVARAIAASAIPVISAVGHETDFTIADFAADRRAATPTAAAELAAPHIGEIGESLRRLEQRLHAAMERTLDSRRQRLQRARRSPYFVHPRRYLLDQAQRLDRLTQRLEELARRLPERSGQRLERLERRLQSQSPSSRAAFAGRDLRQLDERLAKAARGAVKDARQRILSSVRQLDALSPLKVMARGYSLVYEDSNDKLVRSVKDLEPGDLIQVRLPDGRAECHVWAIKEDEQE
ncbi:exodeoxyribonuclease VII large subunit [Paenibacillus pasadenensis]|uniref:Exodeoxyribonuclease 7 large subunit n=1 Tax=Paenibacillus pasadenensis TaxID=217090 RepID=A0A2N5N5C6_9BACL|nr:MULTISPECIES: exodeoxyribonuclease VII large subunit [Paenibacillus]PLT45556.1 Exodeoxyribonuclease VII large subunit [Paenibacillus pasadenensis]QGG56018.1 exodeoxyribonuclease VII large subunit [Paenibacillus sp. B01]